VERRRAAVAIIALVLLTGGAAAAAPAPLPLEVSGATYAEYDARNGVWRLRGSPVVITRGATRLEAAEIHYDERRAVASATGAVTVRHETLTLRAARAEARLREDLVVADGEVVVTARRDGGEAKLTAARVEMNLARRRVVATGQPALTQQEALLSAARLEFDEPTQTVAAIGGAELILPEGRLVAGRIDASLNEDRAQARDAVRITAGGPDRTGAPGDPGPARRPGHPQRRRRPAPRRRPPDRGDDRGGSAGAARGGHGRAPPDRGRAGEVRRRGGVTC